MKFLTQYAPPAELVYTRRTRTIEYDSIRRTFKAVEVTHTINLTIPTLLKLGQSLRAKIKSTLGRIDKFFAWLLLGPDNVWAFAAAA